MINGTETAPGTNRADGSRDAHCACYVGFVKDIDNDVKCEAVGVKTNV